MTFGYGFNPYMTGNQINNGMNTDMNGFQAPYVDYGQLNAYTNAMMGQINNMSYTPFSEYGFMSSIPNWFSGIASCCNVNFTGLNSQGDRKTVTCDPTKPQDLSSTVGGVGNSNKPSPVAQTPEEQVAQDAKQKEVNKICEDLYDAMKGVGTKNEQLKSSLAKITKDNILEVMETYKRLYSDEMDGESLIQSIQNENWVGWSGELTSMTNDLKTKLADRASEMGLDDEARAFSAKVSAENNSWFNIDDDVVNGHFENLYAKMIAKRNR